MTSSQIHRALNASLLGREGRNVMMNGAQACVRVHVSASHCSNKILNYLETPTMFGISCCGFSKAPNKHKRPSTSAALKVPFCTIWEQLLRQIAVAMSMLALQDLAVAMSTRHFLSLLWLMKISTTTISPTCEVFTPAQPGRSASRFFHEGTEIDSMAPSKKIKNGSDDVSSTISGSKKRKNPSIDDPKQRSLSFDKHQSAQFAHSTLHTTLSPFTGQAANALVQPSTQSSQPITLPSLSSQSDIASTLLDVASPQLALSVQSTQFSLLSSRPSITPSTSSSSSPSMSTQPQRPTASPAEHGKQYRLLKEQEVQRVKQQMLKTPEVQTSLRSTALAQLAAAGFDTTTFTQPQPTAWTRALLDSAFDEFADKEVDISGQPRKFLTRPSGDPAQANAGILLHYPTFATRAKLNETAEVFDPSNPCIQQLLLKGFSQPTIVWHDLYCRRLNHSEEDSERIWKQRELALKSRSPELVQLHHLVAENLIECLSPTIWLLAGSETATWYENAFKPTRICISGIDCFINYDQVHQRRCVTRLAVRCHHPQVLFFPNQSHREKMDQQANLFAALAAYPVRANYFEEFGKLNTLEQAILVPKIPTHVSVLQANRDALIHYDPFDSELQQAMIQHLRTLKLQSKSFSKIEFESLHMNVKTWFRVQHKVTSAEQANKLLSTRTAISQASLPDIVIHLIRSGTSIVQKQKASTHSPAVLTSDASKFFGFRNPIAREPTKVHVLHRECLGVRSDLDPMYTSNGTYVVRKLKCFHCGNKVDMHPVDQTLASCPWEKLRKLWVKYMESGVVGGEDD